MEQISDTAETRETELTAERVVLGKELLIDAHERTALYTSGLRGVLVEGSAVDVPFVVGGDDGGVVMGLVATGESYGYAEVVVCKGGAGTVSDSGNDIVCASAQEVSVEAVVASEKEIGFALVLGFSSKSFDQPSSVHLKTFL